MRISNKVMIQTIIQLLVFLGLFLISRSLLKNIYLFEWTSRYLYCCIWIIVLVLCIRKKINMAWFITVGNVVGIVLGQLLGEVIKNFRMKEITVKTSAEEAYQLSQHYGVPIWALTIFVTLVAGELIHKIKVSKIS